MVEPTVYRRLRTTDFRETISWQVYLLWVFARNLLRGNAFVYIYIYVCIFVYTGSAKYRFFWKMLLKKLLNIYSNFFYLKVQSFRLIMENNFIQVAASAGHALAYTIGSIFKHIIDCVQLYFNCLWLVGVTLIFDGTPQIIVLRC